MPMIDVDELLDAQCVDDHCELCGEYEADCECWDDEFDFSLPCGREILRLKHRRRTRYVALVCVEAAGHAPGQHRFVLIEQWRRTAEVTVAGGVL